MNVVAWLAMGMMVLGAAVSKAAAALALPAGTMVVAEDTAAAFRLDGNADAGRCEAVGVEGQAFARTLQATTLRQPGQPWFLQLHAATVAAVAKGDVLLATFQARSASAGGGEAYADFVFEQGGDVARKV